ncbi:MAG: chemotaxis protein CheW [Gemmatimonas sp.]
MNAPNFRSTAAFASRARSAAPVVDRATFVTFSLGGRRLAAPVETVERVLPCDRCVRDGGSHVSYCGVDVPLVDLAAHIGGAVRHTDASRVLILKLPAGWLAAVVDEVHDVAVVDAAVISTPSRSPADESNDRGGEVDLPRWVQGMFVQRDRETLVLDVGRALGFRFS